MKYIIGSLILSFGVLLVAVIILMSINVRAPEDGATYLAITWGVLAVLMYPIAKKIIRD